MKIVSPSPGTSTISSTQTCPHSSCSVFCWSHRFLLFHSQVQRGSANEVQLHYLSVDKDMLAMFCPSSLQWNVLILCTPPGSLCTSVLVGKRLPWHLHLGTFASWRFSWTAECLGATFLTLEKSLLICWAVNKLIGNHLVVHNGNAEDHYYHHYLWRCNRVACGMLAHQIGGPVLGPVAGHFAETCLPPFNFWDRESLVVCMTM